MSTVFKFKPIIKSIIDLTGEEIKSAYELSIPYSFFELHGFSSKMTLYCPSCNFLTTAIMLHAWFVRGDGLLAKKETHIFSTQWAEVMKFVQPNSLYWPNIQEIDIEMFKYHMLFVVQPPLGIEMDGIVLELEPC